MFDGADLFNGKLNGWSFGPDANLSDMFKLTYPNPFQNKLHKLQPLLILAMAATLIFSGMASADGGGHKEVLPDETIIGISLISSLITYFLIPKISKFELSNEQRLVSSLIIFTVVVHAILGIDDLKLLVGAAGFFAFGVAFYVLEIPFVEKNKTIF